MDVGVVDAGPLVALLNRGDSHHEACRLAARKFQRPLLTIWPAFTEAMYLLSTSHLAQDALWQQVESEALLIMPLEQKDCLRMRFLMRKYRDQPMDLADAGLICLAERERIRRIFTLDRKHFSIYRAKGIGPLDVIP